MTRRKGRHWWWLRRRRDGVVEGIGGMVVPPDVLQRWDAEASRRLNRADRHAAKRELSRGHDD